METEIRRYFHEVRSRLRVTPGLVIITREGYPMFTEKGLAVYEMALAKFNIPVTLHDIRSVPRLHWLQEEIRCANRRAYLAYKESKALRQKRREQLHEERKDLISETWQLFQRALAGNGVAATA